ncbi:MAG: hypothetical protein QNJ54_30720 [Prochloraceae cyanobacterium]|nr:hypothetical protein [Prochloraceae cyanobacterium]
MEAKQRKERFIALLSELLTNFGGVKAKLAKNLEINSSTLTRWFQGKTDPATLELANFVRLSEIANLSTDELARIIGIKVNSDQQTLDKFKSLIEELLSFQSMEQLGKKLGVTYGAVSGWVSSQRNINPERIPIGTITALATEKGWTVERLLIYLGIKNLETEKDLLFKLRSGVTLISLQEQIKLLSLLSDLIQEKITQEKIVEKVITIQNDLTICIILEKEDNTIASLYSSNLAIHLQLKPENIKIATPRSMPKSLSFFDVLLFDLNNQQSPCIPLIESLDFDGDVVAFVDRSLPQDIQDRLKQKVTEVIVKPISWSELKQKAYFS